MGSWRRFHAVTAASTDSSTGPSQPQLSQFTAYTSARLPSASILGATVKTPSTLHQGHVSSKVFMAGDYGTEFGQRKRPSVSSLWISGGKLKLFSGHQCSGEIPTGWTTARTAFYDAGMGTLTDDDLRDAVRGIRVLLNVMRRRARRLQRHSLYSDAVQEVDRLTLLLRKISKLLRDK